MNNMIEVEYMDKVFMIPEFVDVDAAALQVEYRDEVYNAMYISLGLLAEETEWESAPCFIANDVTFELDRSQSLEHLNNCLSYFTETEEYEKCGVLVNLKTKLL